MGDDYRFTGETVHTGESQSHGTRHCEVSPMVVASVGSSRYCVVDETHPRDGTLLEPHVGYVPGSGRTRVRGTSTSTDTSALPRPSYLRRGSPTRTPPPRPACALLSPCTRRKETRGVSRLEFLRPCHRSTYDPSWGDGRRGPFCSIPRSGRQRGSRSRWNPRRSLYGWVAWSAEGYT